MSASRASRLVCGLDGLCSEHRHSRRALEESRCPDNTKPLTLMKGVKGFMFVSIGGRGDLNPVLALAIDDLSWSKLVVLGSLLRPFWSVSAFVGV